MKRLITLALMAVTMTAQAQTTNDPYKPLMDAYDQQADNILKEYRAIHEKDPKGELPESKAKAKILSDRLDSIGELQLRLIKEIIHDNRDNQLPAKYIKDAMYQFSYEELKDALDPKTAYYNNPDLDIPKRLLAGYEKRKPGIQFHELTMKDPVDQDVTLSQWVGKGNYVLVDFWASWCGPCRQEMPFVVTAYDKYQSKGFNVVGVSFDQKKDAWVKGIQQLGMKWPQMSDLKGWKCAASEAYGISSIPSNVLVDPTGKIVAMDLRSEKLLGKLKEIYGE
ncbi:MAG: TlpA family protein disulfide reductase [Prevotella sp.]|nr:TlpA family protein disulfide reductase [Prevotella sp.]